MVHKEGAALIVTMDISEARIDGSASHDGVTARVSSTKSGDGTWSYKMTVDSCGVVKKSLSGTLVHVDEAVTAGYLFILLTGQADAKKQALPVGL